MSKAGNLLEMLNKDLDKDVDLLSTFDAVSEALSVELGECYRDESGKIVVELTENMELSESEISEKLKEVVENFELNDGKLIVG